MSGPLLAILGPLTAAIVIVLARRAAVLVAILGACVGLAGAITGLLQAAHGERLHLVFGGLPGFPLRLRLDPLAGVLAVTVGTAALLVLIYAAGYMAREPDRRRFFAEMSFFIAVMQTLVLAGDWVLFLAAWESIGLCSYLLIGFWFERPGAREAATRAFLTTRGADLGLYVAVFVLLARTGTSEIAATLSIGGTTALVASLLLLLAAAGKAAQVPFQGWLQDAMLGPTPVSALLHSATLVAAGAILLVRVTPLLPAPVRLLIGIVGGVTALLTGVTALGQRDLKRLLASSTSSQLGFMLLAIGGGSAIVATVHLVMHAAMKSSLFLGAGIFQHERESTAFARLRGIGRASTAAFALFTIAGLALVGVPPLAGFWSKDAIEATVMGSSAALLLAPLVFLGTALTGAYIARAVRQLWEGEDTRHAIPGRIPMVAGLAVLTLLAATLGFAAEPIARLLGGTLPQQPASLVLGLSAEAVGLLAGWLVPAELLLGPLRPLAERGFRMRDGWLGLAARPALHTADSTTGSVERPIAGGAFAVGRSGLAIARAARNLDERGLDRLVLGLARAGRELGTHARQLQSGLVFRELVLAAAGAAAAAVLLVLAR